MSREVQVLRVVCYNDFMKEGKTIGIVGGGQLGRMLTLAALPLGFKVVVVDPSPNSPAAQVGASEITANLYDKQALKKLAKLADYITIEIEHLDVDILEEIEKLGTPVNPSPSIVRIIQDKLKQKEFFASVGIPVAPFVAINSKNDAKKALKEFGGKMLLKTRLGAYDGRGNMAIENQKDIDAAFEKFSSTPLYAEKFIPFKKELAVMVSRGMDGSVALYPVVETIHQRNICVEVLAPADIPDDVQTKALKVASTVGKHLKGAGMFGIEMFLTNDDTVLVNEIAPRVHNSGHYSMDASRTSQFEQHIRAISGLPLGSTQLLAPAAVMVNILGEHDRPTIVSGLEHALSIPEVTVHIYGKSPTKVDRKMGHINATGKTIQEARTRANKARKVLSI